MESMCCFSSECHPYQSCILHITAPSEPRGLEVVTTSDSSVTLQWDPPAVLGDTSVNYIIGYVGAGTLFTTPNTIFEITGLSPSTMNNFTVTAKNSVGTSTIYVVAMTRDGTWVQYKIVYMYVVCIRICMLWYGMRMK